MAFTQYHISEDSWNHHFNVVTAGGKHPMYIAVSPNEPAITVYDGTSIDAPVLGLATFRRFSSNCDVRLDADKHWTHLTKKGLMSLSPSFSFDLPFHGEPYHLTWKKTRSLGSYRSSYGNLKLVDDEQKVLAVFSAGPVSGVTGTLEMQADFGDEIDRMTLLTLLAVRERQRRHTTRSAREGRDQVMTMGAATGGASAGGGA
ncbi:hypothetical protein N7492_004074 [Penicillium capsulatum]|uniref:Uncharacterized protein n=1 Tax=Penicillium capsulatum TaxID=69766 RepID=A0A9W9LXI6_9EURO|nr:hypothetical protein N7492_004074 [Penicillium capsulatum]KAJ6121353.1 hypothetical protein N7512_003818 [Penicillium capsulatum]